MDKSLNFILFSLYYHPHSIAIFCHFVAVKAFFVLLSDCAVPHWVYSAVLSQSLAGIKECCHWKESRVCCVDHLLCPFLSKLFFKRQVAICPQTKGDQALSPSPHPSFKAEISQSCLFLICLHRHNFGEELPGVACLRMSTTETNFFTCPVILAAMGQFVCARQTKGTNWCMKVFHSFTFV